MSKLFRSLLWSGLVVAGVAACGDDVTVNAPGVRSISVAPDGVTIQVGQTLQMTASVNADAGIATTVTWASSDASKATVSATGLVTGVAAGSVAIQACSTVNPAVCGAATVTIGAVVAATISIDGITNTVCTGFSCNEVPVLFNNVAGQIQVHLNLDAGNQKVSSVDVLIDGVVAGSQAFSLVQWQELVARAQAAAAAAPDSSSASLAVPITISINTALFNPATGAAVCPGGTPSAAGAACFLNGPRLLSARANLVGSAPKATPSISLIFNNANTIIVTTSVTNGSSASSATGILWQTGDLTATAVLVIYTPGTNTIQQVVLTPTGMGSKTLTTAPYTATWAKATSSASGGSGGVENQFTTVTANSTLNGVQGPNGLSAALAFDNKAPSGGGSFAFPGVPVINWSSGALTMPNGRTGGWINKDVVLNGLATSSGTGSSATAGLTSNGFICNNQTALTVGNCAGITLVSNATAPTDFGIGTVTITFKEAQTTSLTTAAAAAATTSSTVESITNTSYCGVAQAVDGLGNATPTNPTTSTSTTCSTLIGAGAPNIVRHGTDNTPPTAAVDASSLSDGQRVAVSPIGGNFVLLVNDPGAPATASGIQQAKWLLGRLSASSSVSGNYDAFGAGPTSSTAFTTGPACGGGLCSTAIGGLATTGTGASYWTAQGLVLDAAGNTSPTVTTRIVADATAPTVTGPSVPASISGAFNASGASSDNLDLRDFWFSITYSNTTIAYLTPPVIQLNATPIAINTFPPVPGTLQNTNVALGATINTPLMLQSTTGAGAPNAYSAAAAGQALSGATVNVRDQTGPYVSPAVSPAPIAFASLVLPTSGISTTNFTSFITSASNTSLCALAAVPPTGCTVGSPSGQNFASTVITATASGATSVFNNPFGRVDFYCTNGAVLIALGSSSSPQLNDNGAVRTWAYSLTESAADLFAKCGGVAGGSPGAPITPNLWAWGVNAAGTVALVAQPFAGVTINP